MDRSATFEDNYAKQQVIRKLYRSIPLFGRTCFPTALNKAVPPFHTQMYSDLQNKVYRRLLYAAPRGTAKSSVISFLYPVWELTFKPSSKELFIVIISESQAQSVNFLARIKHHLNFSDEYRGLFGDYGENTARRWREDDIILRNGTRIVAVGTGQRIRGYITGDTRPNLIIVDDCESELNAMTPDARAKNRKWLTEAVIPSMADNGRIVVVGTPISEDCFLYWAKGSKAWRVRWWSIINEYGESIWPERFPLSRIEEIKEEFASVGNLNGFYQEYMCIAQAPEAAPFKPKYIRWHDFHYEVINGQQVLTDSRSEETKHIPVVLYAGVDPASSLSNRADFFVIAVVAVDMENNHYLVDVFREHLDPADQPDKIIEYYKRYTPRTMRIETVAYQEALRATVRRRIQEQELYIPGLEAGVKPRNPKSERILSLVPLFAKGKFFLRHRDKDAETEFLSYPRGRNDDILDAIWTAVHKAKPPRKNTLDYLGKKGRLPEKKEYDWHVL